MDIFNKITGKPVPWTGVLKGVDQNGNPVDLSVNAAGQILVKVENAVLPTGAATQTTLAAVLNKLSDDPASQTTLAAILEALQGTISTELLGSNVVNLTAEAVLADVNILSTNYTAQGNQMSVLNFSASVGGVLSYVKGTTVIKLNGGVALLANTAYTFDVPMSDASEYNLQYSAAGNVTIDWLSGVL